MEQFDRISIEEVSKRDMLMILKALEYTGENTKIESFILLKDSILKQLSALANTTEEEFLLHLQK
ncbi:hypothetical protein SAMN02745975_03062 [Geosporobacter subterraneus DSM 17957]|uniref:Uncharacterized protein n=1 Tax=Geosporobacter subterraneus DSM 17957 TaxID=1121919 RepID=A0A1M6MQR0_9FIRM|nr:hypothetical protein [Geosporobacter subterraneus]SHJ85811.1 hypothetical protein SAMN02745975_03062 [Geosporobacter subterraneus DSM 17957]